MQAYSVRGDSTTGDEDARREKAAGILKGMTARDMRLAIDRADRRTRDRAGRQWQIGPKVAALVCQLFFRDGQGEADDGSIHQTAFAWQHGEAALTESELRTARRVATEEGLVESRPGRRPGDRQKTVFYRLNLWEVARVVARSELENVGRLLESEGRKKERDRLNKRRRELERTMADLDVIDQGADVVVDGDAVSPGGILTTCRDGGETLTAIHNTTQGTSLKERVPRGTPKKDPPGRSLRDSQKKQEKTDREDTKLTADEAYELWYELLVADPFGDHLDALAGNMAERNKTKQVRYTRLWRKIGERYLDLRESEDLSDEAWAYGFDAAAMACTPSMSYVVKAARGYHSVVAPEEEQGAAAAPHRGSYSPTWRHGITLDVTEDDGDEVECVPQKADDHAATDGQVSDQAPTHADAEEAAMMDVANDSYAPEDPAPRATDGEGEEPEEVPSLTGEQRGRLVRLMLTALGGESEVSRLADAHVEDPEGVPPERVADAAMTHLPGDTHPAAVLASVEGVLVGMRGEWP